MNLIILVYRCTAPASDIDAEPERQGRHCQEHTRILVEELGLGELWDEYGLVGDIVVGALYSFTTL